MRKSFIKKILSGIATVAMTIGGVSASATTVSADATSELTISVPGGEDNVYYFLDIVAASNDGHVGNTFTITDGSGSNTYTFPGTNNGEIIFPIKKGEVLTIPDANGHFLEPDFHPDYGKFIGFNVNIYPFYFNGQHFWNEVYHFSPVDEGYPDWLVQRWNTALAAYPTSGSVQDDISFFDQYNASDPTGYPWIDYYGGAYATSFDFAFTDNYQISDQDTVWNRTTDAQSQMSFHIVDTVDDTQTYDRLQNVYIDSNSGQISEGTDFTKDHGSVIINLEPSYLTGLSDGEHTLVATFPGLKKVQTTFTVQSGSSPTPSGSDDYTPVDGSADTLSISKYLIVNADATVPETTVTFSIAHGQGVAADPANHVFEVLEGVGTPTIGSVSFSSADTKLTTVQAGDSLTLPAGKNYVKKSMYVDFSSVSFDEPGVYRYVITESCADEATFIDMDVQKNASATAKTRILDVYVTDDGSGNLVLSRYVLHEILGNIASGADAGTAVDTVLSDKSDGFVNEAVTYNLGVANTTTGNQGSRDKYFDYTVTLSGLQANHTYHTDLVNATAKSGVNSATIEANANQDNVTEFTTDENGSATIHYYLQNGEKVLILGLPRSASYAVTANAEDYKQTAGSTVLINQTQNANPIEPTEPEPPIPSAPTEPGSNIQDQMIECTENGGIWNGNSCEYTTPGGDPSNPDPGNPDPGETPDPGAGGGEAPEEPGANAEGAITNSMYGILIADPMGAGINYSTRGPVSNSEIHDDPTSGEFATLQSDVYTGYTHTRSGVIPTGVMAGMAGTILVLGLAIVGLLGKKRNAYED